MCVYRELKQEAVFEEYLECVKGEASTRLFCKFCSGTHGPLKE